MTLLDIVPSVEGT